MAEEPTARPVAAEIPILVGEDVSCRKCSYNLRGLFGDGRCPECGTPVGISLRGDLLRYADPEWVRKLALGVRYIFIGMLVTVVVSVAGILVLAQGNMFLAQLVPILAGAVGFYGIWLMTEPDPSGVGEDPTVTARKFIRVAMLLGIVSQVLTAMLHGLPLEDWIRVTLLILTSLMGIIALGGEFAKYTYLRNLAYRIPDDKLAIRANRIRWGYVIPTNLSWSTDGWR